MTNTRAIPTTGLESVLWRAILPVLALLPLASCTTAQVAGVTPASIAAPAQEQVGEGKTIIGLLSALEPANLSDGAVDSAQLAAKLAVTSLADGLATLEVRPSGSTESAARQGAETLVAAGAKIVVAADNSIGSVAAQVLGPRNIPTLSLAAVGDTGAQLYGAGLVVRDEAGAMAAEFVRRNYTNVAIAVTPDPISQGYAGAVSQAAAGGTVSVTGIDASSPANFLAGVDALAHKGKVDAIVFATGPARAAELVAALRVQPARGAPVIVGNASWATAEPLGKPLDGAWYPSLPRDKLAQFVSRFRAAYGSNPTLRSAVVYDLVIMAAVLPATIPENPYAPASLRSIGGFSGFSGSFNFGAANLAERRVYEIVTAR